MMLLYRRYDGDLTLLVPAAHAAVSGGRRMRAAGGVRQLTAAAAGRGA
ncbi:hypothetical protein [Nocardia thraciensis]